MLLRLGGAALRPCLVLQMLIPVVIFVLGEVLLNPCADRMSFSNFIFGQFSVFCGESFQVCFQV